jgi:hypothetical protein
VRYFLVLFVGNGCALPHACGVFGDVFLQPVEALLFRGYIAPLHAFGVAVADSPDAATIVVSD